MEMESNRFFISKRNASYPTIEDLRNIVSYKWTRPKDNFNEVYPGIVIGDAKTAIDINILKSLGITHIINGALGKDPNKYVYSSLKYYHKRNLYLKKYLGIKAMDIMNFQLHPFFPKSSELIEEALNSNGKVLIHCREGISRSATLVIAFLMMKRNMSSRDAIQLVRQKREIYPNDGFLEQLIDLDIRLKTRQ